MKTFASLFLIFASFTPHAYAQARLLITNGQAVCAQSTKPLQRLRHSSKRLRRPDVRRASAPPEGNLIHFSPRRGEAPPHIRRQSRGERSPKTVRGPDERIADSRFGY
jgi:hypothetical protein